MTRKIVTITALCSALALASYFCLSHWGCRGPGGSHGTASGQVAMEKPYVASQLREPFHRPTCAWAKKINPENLVGYDTREQAEADGHRPCKVCKP